MLCIQCKTKLISEPYFCSDYCAVSYAMKTCKEKEETWCEKHQCWWHYNERDEGCKGCDNDFEKEIFLKKAEECFKKGKEFMEIAEKLGC